MCPNINNEQIRNEFNEIVTALGGNPLTIEEFRNKELRLQRTGTDAAAMDAAYDIWDQNQGNPIDKAPNGSESILFKSLVDHYGDRQKAVIAKANTYSKAFKNWFGDWTSEDATNVSKVVDENGEPRIVFHGSNQYGFETFDPLKSDDKISIFTSSSKFIASTYTTFQPISNSLVKSKLIESNAIELIQKGDYESLKKIIQNILDYDLPQWYIDQHMRFDNRVEEIYNEFHKSDVDELSGDSLLAELQEIEDFYRKGRYRVKINTDPEITIEIHDDFEKEMGSRLIEEGVLFNGTPEQLIESLRFDDKVYSLFLNIKNPLVLSGQVGEFGAVFNWNNL